MKFRLLSWMCLVLVPMSLFGCSGGTNSTLPQTQQKVDQAEVPPPPKQDDKFGSKGASKLEFGAKNTK